MMQGSDCSQRYCIALYISARQLSTPFRESSSLLGPSSSLIAWILGWTSQICPLMMQYIMQLMISSFSRGGQQSELFLQAISLLLSSISFIKAALISFSRVIFLWMVCQTENSLMRPIVQRKYGSPVQRSRQCEFICSVLGSKSMFISYCSRKFFFFSNGSSLLLYRFFQPGSELRIKWAVSWRRQEKVETFLLSRIARVSLKQKQVRLATNQTCFLYSLVNYSTEVNLQPSILIIQNQLIETKTTFFLHSFRTSTSIYPNCLNFNDSPRYFSSERRS